MLKQIIKEIKTANKIALFHHVNPDGDSISSSYGLLLALKIKFPNKEIVWVANKEFLQENYGYLDIDWKNDVVSQIDESYLGIIGDTSMEKRVDCNEQFLKCHRVVCFDHHQNGLELKADLFWHEPSYPASAMQAIEIALALKIKLDSRAAFFLCIGLLSDTGNFAFSLANPQPVSLYAKMLEYIDNATMDKYFNSIKRKTPIDIEIQKQLLSLIKYSKTVSYVLVDKKMVQKYSREAIKNKIHSIGNIEGFPVWIMFIEKLEAAKDEDGVEVHFRSNGPSINGIASEFGGGGHKRAAGAKVKSVKEIKDVLERVDKLVTEGK